MLFPMRSTLIVLSLCLAGCASAPRARRPGTLSARERPMPASSTHAGCELSSTDEPRACAIAVLDSTAGVMDVALRIDPRALPEKRRRVTLAFRQRSFGPRYAEDFVQVIESFGAGSECRRSDSSVRCAALAARAGASWPMQLNAVREPVEIRYRVALDEYERARPRQGRTGVSWRRPGGWHLTGKSFLPDIYVDGERVDVPATLRLEVGSVPLWTAAGGDRRLFDAPSLGRLADEAYEVGAVFATRRDAGQTDLFIVQSAEQDDAALEATADVLARAIAALTARLGPPPTNGVLFAFHRVEEPAWSERLGSSLVHVGAEGLPRDPLYSLAPMMRELGRLWNPGSHTISEDWLAEGVTDYLAVQTAAELTSAPPIATARVVLRSHARYARGAREQTLRNAANGGRWAYDAGLVAGFCLDAHLHESRSSLGAVLRTTLSRDEDRIGVETLLEDLAAIAPSSASYLEALLATQGSFGIEDCLERFGFSTRDVPFEGFSDRTLSSEVLGVLALGPFTHSQSFLVQDVVEGSLFERGDVVTSIEGHRVADLDDVAWALRSLSPGDRYRVSIRRRGVSETLQLAFPALDASRREARRYVELVAIDRNAAVN